MNAGEPCVVGWVERFRIPPVKDVDIGRPRRLSGFDVPLPGRRVRALQGEAQLLFVVSKRLLRAFPGRNVRPDRDVQAWSAVVAK